MKLKDLLSVSHTDNYVIYDCYLGIDQEPDCVVKSNNEIWLMSLMYGHRQIAVIEAVEDSFYIWLEPEEEVER